MKNCWNDVVITKIELAVYVGVNSGKHIHENRPSHGLVLNDENSIKEYCFSDGKIMRTDGCTLFYLPKSSSYHVKTIKAGGCYAINFDAELCDEPFCAKPKNTEALRRNFKNACDEWRIQAPSHNIAAMCALYDGIYLLKQETEAEYMPSERYNLILPAVKAIDSDFASRDLTVEALATLCGISDVYLRKIFFHSFGVSPKEYIIRKRMEYAKQLLSLGELEVNEIAVLCGYGEPCHFSREFKKHFGVSPRTHVRTLHKLQSK